MADAGSLTAASKPLRIDPATIGRRIARLEAKQGALFLKSPKGYELTTRGVSLKESLSAVDNLISRATQKTAEENDQLTGQIRIGAPDGCANFILPQICKEIGNENPGLEIQLVSFPRMFNLSKREADMAITVSPPSSSRLSCEKLGGYKLHLVASKAYLENAPAVGRIEDLKHHKIVGYISDLIFDRELDFLSELGVEVLPLSSNSVTVQMRWACEGAGLMIAHDFALSEFAELRKCIPDQFSLKRQFHLVRHAEDIRNPRVNRFAAALKQRFAAEIKRLEELV